MTAQVEEEGGARTTTWHENKNPKIKDEKTPTTTKNLDVLELLYIDFVLLPF